MHKPVVIVNEQNEIIGSGDSLEAHRKGLWHRIAVVYVVNAKGQLFLQKRSATVDSSPNTWDHSAAGHVDADETPEEAAYRELSEELGITGIQLEFLKTYKTSASENNKHYNRFWYLYTCQYEGIFTLEPEEISEGKFVNIHWLQTDLQNNPTNYTKGLKKSLNIYLAVQQENNTL